MVLLMNPSRSPKKLANTRKHNLLRKIYETIKDYTGNYEQCIVELEDWILKKRLEISAVG